MQRRIRYVTTQARWRQACAPYFVFLLYLSALSFDFLPRQSHRSATGKRPAKEMLMVRACAIVKRNRQPTLSRPGGRVRTTIWSAGFPFAQLQRNPTAFCCVARKLSTRFVAVVLTVSFITLLFSLFGFSVHALQGSPYVVQGIEPSEVELVGPAGAFPRPRAWPRRVH
jgi:hypothetical protein